MEIYEIIFLLFIFAWKSEAGTNTPCAVFKFKNIRKGTITAEENSLVNVTFRLKGENCTDLENVFIQISSLNTHNNVFESQCNIKHRLSNCSGTVYPQMACTCVSIGVKDVTYRFTKTVVRRDNKQWRWSTTGGQANEAFLNFNVTYASRVINIIVDGHEGSFPSRVQTNQTIPIMCSWENGNPPTTFVLKTTQGDLLSRSSKSDSLSYNLVITHCINNLTVSCEAPGSERNMSSELIVHCKPQNSRGKDGLKSKYFHDMKGDFIIRFQVEGIPTPHITSITVADTNTTCRVLEENAVWQQFVLSNGSEPFVTTIVLSILKLSNDLLGYYEMNVSNSQGSTTLHFELQALENIHNTRDMLLVSSVSATVVTTIVAVVIIAGCLKRGSSRYTRVNRKRGIEVRAYTDLAVEVIQTRNNTESNEDHHIYEEIPEDSESPPGDLVKEDSYNYNYIEIKSEEYEIEKKCYDYLQPANAITSTSKTCSTTLPAIQSGMVSTSIPSNKLDKAYYLHCIETARIPS